MQSAVDAYVHALRDEDSGPRGRLLVNQKVLLQLRDDFSLCVVSNLQSDVDSTCFRWNTCSSFNKVSQPCKTRTLSANRTSLRLQEEVFALRS